MPLIDAPVERRVLRVRGTVQGVGFRPFVYRTAVELGLCGAVWNEPDGVVIDAEGSRDALDALARRIADEAPPRAVVEALEVSAERGYRPTADRSNLPVSQSM